VSTTVRALLARAPRGVVFTDQVAKRLIGQRVTSTRDGGRTVGKVIDAWVVEGHEVHAEFEVTDVATEKALKEEPPVSIQKAPSPQMDLGI
jgi:hypothetical protein